MSMTVFGSKGRAFGLLACLIAVVVAVAAIPASAAPAPGAKTDLATQITSTTATLNGTLYTGTVTTTWQFQFGTTTNYGSTTTLETVPGSTKPIAVSATLKNLTPGTTYHFRLAALQQSAPYATPVVGQDMVFSTPDSAGSTGPSGVPGVAVTQPATATNTTVATLNGTVNTQKFDVLWRFEYGTTTNYGTLTPTQVLGGSASPTPVSWNITGLKPGTTYHFKLIVLQGSPYQQPSIGADVTFRTLTKVQASKFGVASLTSTKVPLKHSSTLLVSMTCKGARGAPCKGKVTVLGCGKGRFVASAGHTHIIRIGVIRECARLVNRAKHRKLKAVLIAVFTTHQTTLAKSVILTG
jgi:hypothetical protein